MEVVNRNYIEILGKEEETPEIAETYAYDVVVVGAGTPGIPCALRAQEKGLSVAVIQKESAASACGNIGAGIVTDESKPEDVARLVSIMQNHSGHRPKREVLEVWAKYSGDAVSSMIHWGEEAGCQVQNVGTGPHKPMLEKYDLDIGFVTALFGPKPYSVGRAVKELAAYGEKKGIDFYYKTRGVKLEKDGDRVVGVIARRGENYLRFAAKKGVVIATGDYQNDEEMSNFFLPDMVHYERKKRGRTGDGHRMVVRAGGRIENIGHTKMAHDFDAGPAEMMDMPFLRVKRDGTRFCNEEEEMAVMNCYLLSEEDEGNYFQIFDDAYPEKAKDFPGEVADKETIKNFMPEEDIAKRKGVIRSQIGTFKADSLEELAEKLGIEDIEKFVETVERYNENARKGSDPDFGVNPKYLQTIDTPPYYGIHRHLRLTMALGGVVVDGNLNCLDENDKPIPGLYAAGNVCGCFFGSRDYPMTVLGLNHGNNYTQGYFLAEHLAK